MRINIEYDPEGEDFKNAVRDMGDILNVLYRTHGSAEAIAVPRPAYEAAGRSFVNALIAASVKHDAELLNGGK